MANGQQTHLGQDLHLGFVADEEGRIVAGPLSHVDIQRARREGARPKGVDLVTVNGIANLVQSLILRLKTEQGELAPLGHPTYGSRHHQLVGEPNTEHTRNLIKLYVLECLKQEPRIVVQRVTVKPALGRENRDKVDITVQATIKATSDPLNFVVPFFLDGVPA